MNARWSTTIVVLHWLTAAILVGMATAGFVMSDLPSDSSLRLLLSRSHTIFGLSLMAITVARLVVRWRGKSPAPLPLAPLHRHGVDLVHGLIYAVLFGLGASGVATALGSAWPGYVRGEQALAPDLEALASREVHEVLVFALIGLVVLHVGGVIVQQLRQGGALSRMIPFLGGSRSTPEPVEKVGE